MDVAEGTMPMISSYFDKDIKLSLTIVNQRMIISAPAQNGQSPSLKHLDQASHFQ